MCPQQRLSSPAKLRLLQALHTGSHRLGVPSTDIDASSSDAWGDIRSTQGMTPLHAPTRRQRPSPAMSGPPTAPLTPSTGSGTMLLPRTHVHRSRHSRGDHSLHWGAFAASANANCTYSVQFTGRPRAELQSPARPRSVRLPVVAQNVNIYRLYMLATAFAAHGETAAPEGPTLTAHACPLDLSASSADRQAPSPHA